MMRLIGFVILIASSLVASPSLNHQVLDTYFNNLPSPFSPLDETEEETDWGKEYTIGLGLAREFDLYRAVTAFKRGQILTADPARKQELEYETLLTYYLGKRYQEIATLFAHSSLDQAGPDFAPFHDLLVILYDTFDKLEEEGKAAQILQLIHHHYPDTFATLQTYNAFKNEDLKTLESLSPKFHGQFLDTQKSPKKTAFLNAVLPGSGYYYIGLKNTAVTALLLNALFLLAVIYFFRRRAIAAALIFMSFSIGWYVGGIQGGLAKTKYYNERHYEALANPLMNREGIFPVHLLRHGF